MDRVDTIATREMSKMLARDSPLRFDGGSQLSREKDREDCFYYVAGITSIKLKICAKEISDSEFEEIDLEDFA